MTQTSQTKTKKATDTNSHVPELEVGVDIQEFISKLIQNVTKHGQVKIVNTNIDQVIVSKDKEQDRHRLMLCYHDKKDDDEDDGDYDNEDNDA